MIGAVIGLGYQTGLAVRLPESGFARSAVDAAQRAGVVLVVAVTVLLVVGVSALLAVLFSWLTYGNLLLRRGGSGQEGVLHLRHGLLRVREHTYDMRRLRGATLREPLLVRLLRGARLDAVMTGVHGEGQSSMLLPPCPFETATAVLTDLIDNTDAAAGPLRRHGPAAARRRWTRALLVPTLAGVALIAAAPILGVPGWAWTLWAVLTAGCAGLAVDRVRSLGHRVADGWLVARAAAYSVAAIASPAPASSAGRCARHCSSGGRGWRRSWRPPRRAARVIRCSMCPRSWRGRWPAPRRPGWPTVCGCATDLEGS